jgi:hypothetical protein
VRQSGYLQILSHVSDLNTVGIFLDNKLGYNLIGKIFFNTEFAESLQLPP